VKLRHAVGQDLDNRRFTLSVQRVGVFAGDEFNHKVAVISPAIAKMETLAHLSLSLGSMDGSTPGGGVCWRRKLKS